MLIQKYNPILRLTVTRTVNETEYDLVTATAWAISSKTSLTNNNGFSPNQLVFRKVRITIQRKLFNPALADKTSIKKVQKNSNFYTQQEKIICISKDT